MTHEEAGGLVLLAALVLLILWVGAIRWREDAARYPGPPVLQITTGASPDPWTPETSLQSAGSPCRADGCPAMRYAPLDEHLVTAHHAHDNRKPGLA
jgi:hypothetical protein